MGTLSPEAMAFLKKPETQTAWAAAGDELPPDGEYICRIEGFDFFKAKNPSSEGFRHEYMKTMLSVWEGSLKGAPIETIHVVTSTEKFKFLRRHVEGLGAALEDPGDLLDAIAGLQGGYCAVTIKTSATINENTGQPYRNAYCNGPVAPGNGSDLPSDTPAGASVADDDDIPF